MSQWGVFHDDGGHVHVAPCTSDGRITLQHWLRLNCSCGPKAQNTKQMDAGGYALVIWVHQDREAGGYDG